MVSLDSASASVTSLISSRSVLAVFTMGFGWESLNFVVMSQWVEE